jgi:hypothetical protein
MRTNILRRLVIGIGMLVAFVALSPAQAQAVPPFPCTQGIQQITWDTGGLFIDCIGQPNRFVAYAAPTCGLSGGIDNIKLFEALATSAFLSGKTLIISYLAPNTPGCGNSLGLIGTLSLSR